MPGLDESLPFFPLNIAVLTVSDSRTMATDTAGAALAERIESAGHRLAGRKVLASDVAAIRQQVAQWVAEPGIDIVLTTGGTGFLPSDVTPEAIQPLLQRTMDGFSVVFHQVSMGTVGVSTLQSRAFAGQAGGRFVFCLPGSTGACQDAWDLVLRHEFDSRYRPCSIAGLIPRLTGLCA